MNNVQYRKCTNFLKGNELIMKVNQTTSKMDSTPHTNNFSQFHHWNDTNVGIDDSDILCEVVGKCLYTFLVPIICAFGIVGNVCSFKVFVCSSFRRQTSTIYLAALCVTDTGFLLNLLFSWIGGGRLGFYFGSSVLYCRFAVYIQYVCSFLSVWYVVMIMIDRYIVICHPLKVQTLCSRRRCFFVLTVVTIFALLLYAHAFVTSTVYGNQCSLVAEHVQLVMVFTYIDTVITFIVPVVVVFILNVVVLISIKKFKKEQTVVSFQEDPKQVPSLTTVLSTAEVRITFMLIVVSTVFLVTNLPGHVMRLYIMISMLLSHEYENFEVLAQIQHICNIVYYLNFAVNFLLYSSTSRTFRKFLCMGCKHGITRYRAVYRKQYYAYPGKIGGGRYVAMRLYH